MAKKGTIGKEWFLFYNSLADFQTVEASYDTPTWLEVPNAQDITVNAAKEVIEMLRRGAKVKESVVGFGEFSIDFNIDYVRDSAFVVALAAHFDAHDTSWMHFMVLDGTNTTGSKGFIMPAVASTANKEAPILGKSNVPITLLPTYQVVGSGKEWTTTTIA